MAIMVDTVSVEQRLRRLDEVIADAEMASIERTRVAVKHPADDTADHIRVTAAMWDAMDFLTALRIEKMNLLLAPAL